ncbi:MAG: Iron-sulfur flavoprotein [Methanosaeta sp. PtaB.Bin039]|nr:MAG: Iron-sulfur flavoprotein [Methanosaeta sp. PtaB.Bin039]OPY44624.1 MAG: Iron-sulfur flavoprotein [Methanosaeta sp. PtaU1.Bin028]HOT06387.1 flavodoxin family protein [Methanotrichaceae archaeon]HQF16158.1 flavodoxin family protein [Methanotrichaceae archaeon]HQI90894.1 flavodoxin family protein [Methanotrichaceae archaeon]
MIVGISGSPRQKATEHVLTVAMEMLQERGFSTQIFTVRGKKISFCRHCDYCLENKQCVIKDDMYQLYPLLKEAEGFVLATPVYNGAVSAQTKAVMDRCRALLAADFDSFRGKVGMGIAVGGDRAGGQELALQQIIAFYVLNGAIPVGGGAFGANLGATFWSKDTLEGVKEDQEGFRSLRKTVRRFSDQLKSRGASGPSRLAGEE